MVLPQVLSAVKPEPLVANVVSGTQDGEAGDHLPEPGDGASSRGGVLLISESFPFYPILRPQSIALR